MAKVYDNATDLITFARLQSQNTTSGSSYLGSDGLLKFAAEDEPRIEYAADGSLKGLLIEEARTNLLQYSEDFSQWSPVNVSLGGLTTAPSGSADATPLVPNTSINQHRLDFTTTSTAADHTFSVYAKSFGYSGIWIRLGSLTAQFNLATETIYASGGTTTPNIQNAGNGWYRVSISGTAAANDIARINVMPTGAAADFAGDGTSGILIYGAQLEEGSFATSYIPTSGSQSTRSPDIASIPVSAFGYNQEAGTLVVDVETFDTDYNNWVWLLDGTSDTSLYGHTSSGWRVFGAGGTVSYLGSLPGDEAAVIGYAYDASASRCVLGGGVVAGVTNSQPVAVHTLRIGSTGNSAHLNGHIKSLSYFPRRLTDAQLQSLTE